MNALEILRSISGSDEPIDRLRESHDVALEYDDLEPRQLLSTVQGTTNALTTEPVVQGAVGGAATAETLAFPAQPPGGTSVVTHAVGDVNYLQAEIPVKDLVANTQLVTSAVYATVSPISVARGLTSLPITPLIPATTTANETPLNNGTPDLGTVWITMPPVTPGIFHMYFTELPQFASTWMQTVNVQGGPPTFTHLGQSALGSASGAAVNQPVAVGPIGPSITEEVEPVQPPPVESHQPAGPPPMIQQDETTPQQGAQTPPGGQQGAGQPGTPGQEAAPGQPGTTPGAAERSAGGETTQGAQATTPEVPAGQPTQGGGNQGQPGGAQGPAGGARGGSGGPGGAGSGGALLLHPGPELTDPAVDPAPELIDAAIPALVVNPDQPPDDLDDAGALPTAFGAAAVAVVGLHNALRTPDRLGSQTRWRPGRRP